MSEHAGATAREAAVEAAAETDVSKLTLRQVRELAGRTWKRGICPVCLREIALVPSTGVIFRHDSDVLSNRGCPGTGREPQ